MLLIDYHQSFEAIAFFVEETGECDAQKAAFSSLPSLARHKKLA
jgi:hypothetical protein